jgi:phage protein D
MNDRKRAWQILHNEIRRRADLDITDQAAADVDNDAWCRQLGSIIGNADSTANLIIELAGLGATFAELWVNDPEYRKALADSIGVTVMQEPDDPNPDDLDDWDDIDEAGA